MKIVIQSLLFIIVVGLFAVTSDRLSKIEQKDSMNAPATGESKLSDQEFLTQEIHDLSQNIIVTQSKEIILCKNG